MPNLKQVVMTVTFADGSRFHQLADRTMVDDQGFVITRENCPDHYDDMVTTITPNAVVLPPEDFEWLRHGVAELCGNAIPAPTSLSIRH